MLSEAAPTQDQIEARQNEIRKKRIATLSGCYALLCDQYPDFKTHTFLSDHLVANVVEKYLSDREKFVMRNNIKGKIQKHKVAGLMTAAIAKSRPIGLTETDGKAFRTEKVNEFLAVCHGIAICAEGCSDDRIPKMKASKHFAGWFSDLVYLINRHPDSADGFVLIFETLCMCYFPEVLDEKAESHQKTATVLKSTSILA